MSPKGKRHFFRAFGASIAIGLGIGICAALGGAAWLSALVGELAGSVVSAAALPASVVTFYGLCAIIILAYRRALAKWDERRPPRMEVLCEECGYDLFGVPQKPVLRCPECGTERTLDDDRRV